MATRGYGNYLRAARELAGWTQADLAERVSVSTTTVSNWEREESVPNADQVNALVLALRLSAEELLRMLGYQLTPPAAARLPRELVSALLAMDEETLRGVTLLASRAAQAIPPRAPVP